MTIGERIRQAREAKGWTQDYLARKIGVSRQRVQLIEATGGPRLSYAVLKQYAGVFGVTVPELVGDNDV